MYYEDEADAEVIRLFINQEQLKYEDEIVEVKKQTAFMMRGISSRLFN